MNVTYDISDNTFRDAKGAAADAKWATRMGYRMKSLVDPRHARAINRAFTPSPAERARANQIPARGESLF